MRTITKRDLIEGLKRGDIERREAAKALLALKPNLPGAGGGTSTIIFRDRGQINDGR